MGYKNFYIPLTEKENRIRVEINTDKGKVKSFTVQYEFWLNRKWTPVVRYDTAHDYFHIDVLHPNRKHDKLRLRTTNLEEALNYAISDLKLKWDYYREKYIKGVEHGES